MKILFENYFVISKLLSLQNFAWEKVYCKDMNQGSFIMKILMQHCRVVIIGQAGLSACFAVFALYVRDRTLKYALKYVFAHKINF